MSFNPHYKASPDTVGEGQRSTGTVTSDGRLRVEASSAATSTAPMYTAGYGFAVTSAPATTNGAYSAGDVIGAYSTVTLSAINDAPVLITGVQVTLKAALSPNIRVVLFGATPAATLADNAAFTLSAADSLTVRKTLSSLVLGATWFTFGTPKSMYLADRPFVINPISGTKTIGFYVIDDTGVTLTSTSDMQVTFFGTGI